MAMPPIPVRVPNRRSPSAVYKVSRMRSRSFCGRATCLTAIGGSSCIVWGQQSVVSPFYRWYIGGKDDPPVGASIYGEGSFSFETSGTVIQYDTTYHDPDTGVTIYYLDKIDTDSWLNGDSGGAVLERTGFGPLAGGTIEASDGTHDYFNLVGVQLYVEGVTLGTAYDVNLVHSGGSC